ncbi:MAG: hypothetical protein ACPGOY_10315 [Rhodospirillaceae bacterium]
MSDDRSDAEALRALISELESAGIDISTPESRRKLRDDLVFAHTTRKRCERSTMILLTTVVGGVIALLGGWAMAGFQAAMQVGGPK